MSDTPLDQCAENTDREIYRVVPGDFYPDSIHVTREGAIGINCGGFVIVKPIRTWHKLAQDRAALLADTDVAGLVGSLRNTGDRTLSNVGFSTSGESAVAFGALLLNSASALEALSAKLAGHERELEKARQLFYEAAEQRNNALKRLSERRKRK